MTPPVDIDVIRLQFSGRPCKSSVGNSLNPMDLKFLTRFC